MNDGLKQRVIGAIVLVALAVIFLPMLFDFSGERYIDRTSSIPGQPNIQPVQFEQPRRPENIRHPKPAGSMLQPANTVGGTVEDGSPDGAGAEQKFESPEKNNQQLPEAEIVAPDEPVESAVKPVSKPVPQPASAPSWAIQVGAFSRLPHTTKLVQSLLDDGYNAYHRNNTSRGLFFVYVGPNTDKQALLDTQKKIDEKYRVKSKIITFEP